VAAWREHLRGAALLAVVAVQGFAALPLPHSARKSQYDTPIAREEIARWQGALAGMGIRVTRGEIVDVAWASAQGSVTLRKTVLAPFDGPLRWTGTGQGWGLFTTPDAFPHQLRVWIQPVPGGTTGGTTCAGLHGTEGGPPPSVTPPPDPAWRLVYAGLDDTADWRVDQLAYRRVRGVYDGQTTRPGAAWENVARWIADRALEDFPEAARVRVGFVRRHSVVPGETPDPTETTRHLRIHARKGCP
jgi:hypothetical protein